MKFDAVVLAGLLAVSSGCYRIEEEGTTTTLRFSQELLLGLIAICVGGGLGCAWLVIRPKQRAKGILFTVVAGFFAVAILHAMWHDRVVLTPTGAEQTVAHLWFSPTVKRIRYAAVDYIAIREIQGRRFRQRVWFVHLIDGTLEEIDFGDLWENNEDLIVEKLRGYRVQFR
jgi:hypothetical protein